MFGTLLSTVNGAPFGVDTSTAKKSSDAGLSASAKATAT